VIEIFRDPVQLTAFLATSLKLAVPLGFAALGGLLSERSGVFNIGLEGMMLGAAFGAAAGAFLGGSPWIGLVTGVATGAALALLLAVLGVSLGVSQLITGIAINILALGFTSYLSRLVFGGKASTLNLAGFQPVSVPGLVSIPILGPVLFGQDVLVYAMYAAVLTLFVVVFRTPWGLNLRAVGENPHAADAAGISVTRVRYACVVTSGALAGLGGCYLVLSQVFVFAENMTSGKGFIAIAAMILGRWHPVGALLACLLFGLFDALQLRLQFMNPQTPYQIFVALPYLASMLAMVGLVGRPSPPGSLGMPYRREEH
jgi:general nucleoside transport system permease protein